MVLKYLKWFWRIYFKSAEIFLNFDISLEILATLFLEENIFFENFVTIKSIRLKKYYNSVQNIINLATLFSDIFFFYYFSNWKYLVALISGDFWRVKLVWKLFFFEFQDFTSIFASFYSLFVWQKSVFI